MNSCNQWRMFTDCWSIERILPDTCGRRSRWAVRRRSRDTRPRRRRWTGTECRIRRCTRTPSTNSWCSDWRIASRPILSPSVPENTRIAPVHHNLSIKWIQILISTYILHLLLSIIIIEWNCGWWMAKAQKHKSNGIIPWHIRRVDRYPRIRRSRRDKDWRNSCDWCCG